MRFLWKQSLSFKGQSTKHSIVKWSIEGTWYALQHEIPKEYFGSVKVISNITFRNLRYFFYVSYCAVWPRYSLAAITSTGTVLKQRWIYVCPRRRQSLCIFHVPFLKTCGRKRAAREALLLSRTLPIILKSLRNDNNIGLRYLWRQRSVPTRSEGKLRTNCY